MNTYLAHHGWISHSQLHAYAIPVGRYPSSRDMFQGASTAVPGTCKSASNKDKFKHFKQINLQLKNSYSDAYTKETYRIISISPRGWLNPQVQGRKGQTVIYCETQVQNNFRDKFKRVRSPWLIIIYCETQVQNNFRDKLKRVRSPWLIVIYIFGYDQCRMYMDWSNVQVASGADGCAAYSE